MCNTNNTNFAGTRDAANRVIRFDIRQGKLAQWMGQGQQAREYDYVQGYLTGISLRKHEMPTGEMTTSRTERSVSTCRPSPPAASRRSSSPSS